MNPWNSRIAASRRRIIASMQPLAQRARRVASLTADARWDEAVRQTVAAAAPATPTSAPLGHEK